jgi:hypothetical protein
MQLLHYWKLSRVITPMKHTPLLAALYTGGVLYFIALISVRVWAGLIVSTSPSFSSQLLSVRTGRLPRPDVLVYDGGYRLGYNIYLHLSHLSSSK